MPGFFSSQLSNRLTSLSGHYIDWSRVGELFKAGNHHYSMKEFAQRGFIAASMGYGAYYGYYYSEDLESNAQNYLYSMAGCFVGFVVSHMAVIVPLILKRYQMSTQCIAIQTQMLQNLQSLKTIDSNNPQIDELIAKISDLIALTMTINLSDDKHARASQTWGKRLTLMHSIAEKLNEDVHTLSQAINTSDLINNLIAFWSTMPATIYQSLNENNKVSYVSRQ